MLNKIRPQFLFSAHKHAVYQAKVKRLLIFCILVQNNYDMSVHQGLIVVCALQHRVSVWGTEVHNHPSVPPHEAPLWNEVGSD